MPAAGQFHGSASLAFPRSPSEMFAAVAWWLPAIRASSSHPAGGAGTSSPSWLLPARVLQQDVVFRLLVRGGTSSTLQTGPKAHTPLTSLSNPKQWVAAKKCNQNQTRHRNAAVPGVRHHQEAAFPIPPLGRIHRLSQWKCCRDVINDCGLSSVSSTLHY